MFRQIVIVDKTGLRPWALEKLKNYSENPMRQFDDIPKSDAEIIERIQDADCVLVSACRDTRPVTCDGWVRTQAVDTLVRTVLT